MDEVCRKWRDLYQLWRVERRVFEQSYFITFDIESKNWEKYLMMIMKQALCYE